MRSSKSVLCYLLFAFCIAVTVTLALTQPSVAQEITVYEGNQNLPTWGGFSGGDIDTVSLQNGSVHLHIPIASWKERGGTTLRAYFVYDTPTWIRHTTKTVVGGKTYYSTGLSTPINYWFFVNPFAAPATSAPQETTICPGGNGYINVYQHYTVTDPEGTKHPVNLYTAGCNSAITVSPTTDGTGMMVNIGATPAATLKDGTEILYNSNTQPRYYAISVEDTNGNLINTNIFSLNSSTDTMNRPLVQTTQGTGYTLYTITDANGVMQTYRVDLTSTAVTTNFCGSFNNPPYWTCNEVTNYALSVPSKLTLPDGQTYQFSWAQNTPGELQTLTLPTGAAISYSYAPTTSSECTHAPPVGTQTIYTVPYDCRAHVLSRTVTVNGVSSTWNYSSNGAGVTDPNGNEQDHYFNYVFVGANKSPNMVETEVKYYKGSSTSGTLLKDLVKTYTGEMNDPGNVWVGNLRPIRETTTLDNGLVTKTETDYETFTYSYGNTGLSYTYSRLNPIEKREYAYASGAPGPLLRRTDYTYLHNNNSTYANLNIVDRPASVTIYDGSGNLVSRTNYEYDVYNHAGMPAMQASGAVQHDSARGTSYTTRGNRTATSKWLNTNSTWLTSLSQYDDAGNVIASKDPLGNLTQFDYTDTWTSIVGTTGGNACAPSGGPAKAYLTKVTNALNQITTHSYYSCSDSLGSTTDPNSLTSWHVYDMFNREVQSHAPDGGVVTNCYTDTGGTGCSQSAPPFQRVTTKSINASLNEITTAVSDGLGRIVQTQSNSDPQGTVYVDKTYDLVGRVASVSNPYRSGTDPTSSPGTTSYSYDALNRKVQELYPDNSTLKTAYCGNSTLVTDPTGRWRRSLTDALGRLIEVDEPNAVGATVASTGCVGTSEPIWITSYSNDALGNVTQIVQNGSHTRTFTYDTLSRLLTATNPETGQIVYTWDADSNAATKRDARSITTTYGYDALNRLKSETYSNGDPSVTITYDQTACLGLSTCSNIGQRTSMTDASGSEAWAYQVDSSHSRSIHVDQRITTSGSQHVTKTSTYYFDLAGNVYQLVYPTGRVINYAFNAASRLIIATDGSNGITYGTGFQPPPSGCLSNAACYTPQGTFYALSIGRSSSFTGLNLTHIYNNRLQPQEFKASSSGGNAIDISYSYTDPSAGGNAGHVFSITNNLDNSRTQNFTYDQVNRVISAGTASTTGSHCWGYQFSYDAWSNLLSQAGWTPNYNACSETIMGAVSADGNNHISAFSYDASGNAQSDGTYSYSWNAESQLKSAGGVNYTYDGQGRRVSKSNGKLYWYGSGDEVLAETDASGNTTAEYIFFGGKRVAMLPAGGNPNYYVEDILGTSRVITTNTGGICYDGDFTPFGGERAYTSSCSQNYKFEGKERDTETGNDDFEARYYSNRFGRWLSADWSAVPVPVPYANLTNPQTLNLYSMVADDPESFADLDGHVNGPTPAPQTDNCGVSGEYSCNTGPTPSSTAEEAQNTLPWEIPALNGIGKEIGKEIAGLFNLGNDIASSLSSLPSNVPNMPEPQASSSGENAVMTATSVALIFVPVGEAGKAGKIEKLTAEAEKLYPKKAGLEELHHIIPKYLGGAKDGEVAKLPAAYHQLITNEFRRLAPYGQKIERTAEEVGRILQQVYSKYPLE